MIEMAKKQIYPAINEYVTKLAKAVKIKKEVEADYTQDSELIKKLSALASCVYNNAEELATLIEKSSTIIDKRELAFFMNKKVLKCMRNLRKCADEAEVNTAETCWPYPSYGNLLFSVK